MIIPHPHPLRTTASHIHSSFLSLRQKYSRPDMHVVVGIMGLLSCEMGLAGKEFWPFWCLCYSEKLHLENNCLI